MRKLILTLTAAAFALFGSQAYAQTHGTSEDMAAPSKKATKEEKEAAKAQRRATSKEMSKKDEGRVDDKPEAAGPKVKVSKEEKSKAKAKRKEAGTQAAKEGSGRLEDEGSQKK